MIIVLLPWPIRPTRHPEVLGAFAPSLEGRRPLRFGKRVLQRLGRILRGPRAARAASG
jgi:hypothetical protein